MASMEHPIFSVSTKPDRKIRKYVNGDIFVEIKPSADGLATVHDRDVLIYCISQLMASLNEGKAISKVVRFKAYDLLKATNRMTNGQAYAALKASLERLAGTRISTNILTGGREVFRTFGLIEEAEIVRETRDGRMQDVQIKLSDWVYAAIEHKEVLTLSRDYFRLRKPLERRMYEIARKHCGRQREWRISLEKLQLKCGSTSSLREFRRLVRDIVKEDQKHAHMPDYSITLNEDDMVTYHSRRTVPDLASSDEVDFVPPLKSETYDQARIVAPGWDIYLLEQEWRAWITEPPRNADTAFLGFCRKVFERRRRP
ncbi:replication initiator protein A [Blastopirellula marina]|uniref:Plasmid replication initiator RepA n=1 Tax=Blastopirellula marina TaxID=124 RepID=A0A2S8GMM8_9BACT|nr:replication initiator protein A [Blastopirellula marina]PQO45672.1 plasmid replication initiator RepA [Blastopirellula marina]